MRLLIIFFAAAVASYGQSKVVVPQKIQFADLTLTIREDARKELQKDVDAMHRYPASFNLKVERAKTYFPIIEKIFEEENVPLDLKYLVLQESALVPDAVSPSNAVGFWQFKDFTAAEMGLRVDKVIDERMNIVSSSRAAARYLKKNNFYFNNWLFALQAYQMGAGGVMRSEKNTKEGVKHMDITSDTYWYVKKFLAHKLAYENEVKGPGKVQVMTYQNQREKTIESLAKEIAISDTELKSLNKWVKTGTIPEDKSYAVIIPVSANSSALAQPVAAQQKVAPVAKADPGHKHPIAKEKVNGVRVIYALEGDTPGILADRGGVVIADFLKWNDIPSDHVVKKGQQYVLARKRTRASNHYHTVVDGENLWDISQQYAVQIRKLKKYNRLGQAPLKTGTTLWLSSSKPRDSRGQQTNEAPVVVGNESFAWEANAVVYQENPVQKEIPTADPPKATVKAADSVRNQSIVETTIAPDSIATSNPDKTVHVVLKGETLYGISKTYGVEVMELVTWNNVKIEDGIKPGQIVQLRPPAESVAPIEEPITHEVKVSDTLYSIARSYGVTIEELMQWNDKKDFNLSVGEKLKINKK